MRYGKIRIEDGYLAYSRHMMLNSLPCKDIVWAYMRREGDDSPGRKCETDHFQLSGCCYQA